MELDKRIKEGKRPLTCFDIEEAKQYINKRCYFANADAAFSNLDNVAWLREGILTGVFEESEYPFCSHGVHSLIESRQIVPCEWVEEKKEAKYRPYSLEEFFNIFEIGDLIVFKMKNDDEVKCAMFTGYITDVERIDDKTPGAVELMLGIFHYSLSSLFEDFELFDGKEWQPFGVLEE